jgi:hypothetical protein
MAEPTTTTDLAKREHWPEAFFAEGDPWIVVDQMCGDSVYRTHYLCRACYADLTDLRVHYVVRCPYCEVPLPSLLDGTKRNHVAVQGWPYDLLNARFPGWCTWHGVVPGDKGELLPNGNTSWEMPSCRLLADHDGPHDFGSGRVCPPRNPVRGE